MPKVPVQFGAQFAEARSGNVTPELLQNLYLEQNPQGSKGQVALYGTPGLKAWSNVGDGPIRGMVEHKGALWVVSGSELYEVDRSKTATLISGTIPENGAVIMASNGTHVVIATTTKLVYASSTQPVSGLPIGNVNGIAYQDGYFVYSQRGQERFYISGIDDATTINALDFSTADALPDDLKGCVSDQRQLWLFGQDTVEIWDNTGNASFPFQRSAGGFVERGCESGLSIAKADGSVFWLGDDLRVYAAAGYQPQAISTPQIDKWLQAREATNTARAFVYRQEGHTFYCLNFQDGSVCFDISTGLWHTRKTQTLNRWRADTHADIFGLDLVGSISDGDIFELDLDTYQDDGNEIERIAVAPPLHNGDDPVFVGSLSIDMETGLGNADEDDPVVMLDWTDDGGVTYSNEFHRKAGKIGERFYRVRFNRLGRAIRQRSHRIKISDPVKVAITGAYAELEVGS